MTEEEKREMQEWADDIREFAEYQYNKEKPPKEEWGCIEYAIIFGILMFIS